MTVLVTGATGELGQVLVTRLRAEGKSVRLMTRRPHLAARVFSREVDIAEWHPAVEPPPRHVFDGVAAVVHLLGEPSLGAFDRDRLDRYVSSRTQPLEHIIRGLEGRTWRLVQASVSPTSVRADSVLTETSPREDSQSPLASAVLAAETAGQAARSAGASVAVVRLGLLMTTGGAIQTLACDALRGRLPQVSQSSIPVIAPEDAAAMLAGLIDRPDIEGPIHGVAPEALDGRELMAALAAMTRRRFPWSVPMSKRAISRRYGFLAPLLLNQARIVPQKLSEMGAQFAHPDPNASLVRVLAECERQSSANPQWWQALMPPRAVLPEGKA